MKYFILGLIFLYQKTLSPDHGWLRVFFPYGFCRFYPSCSEFVYQSIENLGLGQGFISGVFRILSCNPFNHPRYWPVRHNLNH